MNTLALSNCARRVLIALVAIVGVLSMAACGSGNSRIITAGGFSRASLKGQYVIAQTGTGLNVSGTAVQAFSETIVFLADGAGKLTITVDDFNQGGQSLAPPSLPLTGTYAISGDGTGSLTFGGSSYAITMIDDGHFYIMQQDSGATSSGFGELQDTTAFAAGPPSGNYVFKAHRLNTSSRVGGITITGGAISGVEDLLNLGVTSTGVAITSTLVMNAPNADGRGDFSLNDGTSFNYYVVNSGKFRLMSNNGSLEIGMAEAQSGTFSLATLAAGASYVFGSSGDTAVSGAKGIHSAGVFTSDGNGNITGGTVDYVQDTTLNPDLAVSGGAYTLGADGSGVLSLTLVGGTISPQIFWMVNNQRAYFLVDSAAAVEDGTFTLQTGAPFTALTSHSAFSMDGFDTGGFKDRIGFFAPTVNGTFNWNQESNSFNPSSNPPGLVSALGTTGTYQVSSNGRVTVIVNSVTSGTPGMVFYLSSPNTGVMVEEDSNVGGSFAQQASQ